MYWTILQVEWHVSKVLDGNSAITKKSYRWSFKRLVGKVTGTFTEED